MRFASLSSALRLPAIALVLESPDTLLCNPIPNIPMPAKGRAATGTEASAFSARIEIIDINPYVLLPDEVLRHVFRQAGREKGPIPVKGTINGHPFTQTLVRFRGAWRLYLNTPMRKGGKADVGDTAGFTVAFDAAQRETPFHPKLKQALKNNPAAKKQFDVLPPSRQKEIKRYINNLKTEESITRNVERAILFLLGKERFIGRDKP
jgi:hypothetical protein